MIDIHTLVPFQNHPFKSRDGEEKQQLLQSTKTQGAIEPLIVLLFRKVNTKLSADTGEWRFAENLVLRRFPLSYAI